MNEKQDYLNTNKKSLTEKDVTNYVIERFKDVKKSQKIKNLVEFHAMNKYMLMSHDQEELKKMGQSVAKYKTIAFLEILEFYESHLKKTLKNPPTIKKHSNVLLHIFGHFSKYFESHEKTLFLDLLENYRKEKISLETILGHVNSITFRFNNTYLASQTYFLLYSNQGSDFFTINAKNI
ncbi:MAG: YbgA family protein [Nitrosopumilus sp.]|nr:YbgA family protein [Nitrosopumilus sp.]